MEDKEKTGKEIIYREFIEQETEEAKAAGDTGYMARVLVKATLPHSNPGNAEKWNRNNGYFGLNIQSGLNMKGQAVGLPYGVYPRLILSWMTTEAVRTKQPTLILGTSLSAFMRKLDIDATGGKEGSIRRLKDQMGRLCACHISCVYEDKDSGRSGIINVNIADEADYWWNPKSPEQISMFNSTIELNDKFFKEIIKRPVPLDMNILKQIRRSPMEIDLYDWLTYRMNHVKEKTPVRWEALQLQFGADYKNLFHFKMKFRQHLHAVKLVYPGANFDDMDDKYFFLLPGTPSISPRKKVYQLS